MGLLLIGFGLLSILGGIFGRTFRKADVDSLAEFKQETSTWSGRLVFLAVGACLIAVGVKLLLEAE
jgi:hypothetical protein